MDGFHLADVELDRLGLRERKGAIDTFDDAGYLALLGRVRTEYEHVVYAPAFERTLEQPIAGSIAVSPECRIVVTEGNYLLDGESLWSAIRDRLDEAWFVEIDHGERTQRLIDRHFRFGKTPASARAWVHRVDNANAERVSAARDQADLVLLSMRLPPVRRTGPGHGPMNRRMKM